MKLFKKSSVGGFFNCAFTALAGASVLLWIDRLLKAKSLEQIGSRPLFESPVFSLYFTFFDNHALAFSIQLPFWLILGSGIIIWIFLSGLLIRSLIKRQFLYIFILSWIVIGASSNLFDRIFYGFVMDYLSIRVLAWQMPIFNLSDVMIFVGVLTWIAVSQLKENK
ncbi:MAG: signal peptidase II [Parcubacteria group bacterium]|nr:signal peptidase II [Parcubacteria group bacterium]